MTDFEYARAIQDQKNAAVKKVNQTQWMHENSEGKSGLTRNKAHRVDSKRAAGILSCLKKMLQF